MRNGVSFTFIALIIPILWYSCNLLTIDADRNHYNCGEGDVFSDPIPTFEIDLSKDPAVRWKDIIAIYEKEMHEFKNFIDSLLGGEISTLARLVVSKIVKDLPVEYVEEMRGIANAANIGLEDVALFNTFYEFFTFCTSIIAVDEKNVLYHARNLDFSTFIDFNKSSLSWDVPKLLRAVTIKLVWKDNADVVFESINFVGYIGVLTGLKPKAFSITLNERFKIDGGYIGILKFLLGNHNANWVGYLTRDVLVNNKSYDDALQVLTNVELIAPVYLILGSADKEGATITRGREKAEDVWKIDLSTQSWYLLQTNYDHWKKPPFFDDRITPGNFCMEKLTRMNVSINGIYNVLRSKPLRNMMTIYTAIMIPSQGYLEANLQECPFPCPPW